MTWILHHRGRPGPGAGIPSGLKSFRLGRTAFIRRYPAPRVPAPYRPYLHRSSSQERPAGAASWLAPSIPAAGHRARYIGLGTVVACAGFVVAFTALTLGLVIMAGGAAIITFAFVSGRSRLERAIRHGAELLAAGKPREALARLLPFARHYREDQVFQQWLALAYSRTGQTDLAEQTLRERHERVRTSLSAQLYADQLRLDGKIRDAIEVLEDTKPGSDRAAAHYTMLGNCFLELGDVQDAIDAFKHGPILERKLDRDLMALHFALGGAYEEAENRTGALREYRRVASVNRRYEDVEARIRRLLPPGDTSPITEAGAGET